MKTELELLLDLPAGETIRPILERLRNPKKLLILGHANHGKDYVAEHLAEKLGIAYRSTSTIAAETIIGPSGWNGCVPGMPGAAIRAKLQTAQHRVEWHDLIEAYNKVGNELTLKILAQQPWYIGMRSIREFEASYLEFDAVILVTDPSKPVESVKSNPLQEEYMYLHNYIPTFRYVNKGPVVFDALLDWYFSL